MTTAIDAFNILSSKMSDDVQALVDRYGDRVTFTIKRQLLEWKKAFPRHDFHAWEAHGLLVFEVHPPVMGERFVADLATEPGIIGELGKAAQAFQDTYSLEWKVCLIPSTSIIKL